MAYRGRGRGGRGGEQHRPPYSGRGGDPRRGAAGGGGGGAGAPPAMTPPPGSPQYQQHQPAPHRGGYSAPSPAAPPLGGYTRSTPVTIRALPPSPSLAPCQPVQLAAPQEASPAGEAAAADKDLAPVSKKGLAHSTRPGFGATGKKVIRANYFLVNVADNNLFH